MPNTVTGTLSIIVDAPMAITFTPLSPRIAGNITAGTVVSAITVTGGNGTPVTLGMSGDTTDFALSSTTLPANVIVGPGGIAVANQGKTNTVTVTASQA